jgi:hypothetical protein
MEQQSVARRHITGRGEGLGGLLHAGCGAVELDDRDRSRADCLADGAQALRRPEQQVAGHVVGKGRRRPVVREPCRDGVELTDRQPGVGDAIP